MPLIVLEGIDGCGKTTQADRLCARLERAQVATRRMREPGGTVLGEAMRKLLLDPATKACPTAELFGYLQARAQLCDEVLAPALSRGEAVVLDRFYHSTLAYQGYGLRLDPALVRAANALAIGDIHPDLVVWLTVDPKIAAERRAAARGLDRIEARGLEYLKRVHDGYAEMAQQGEMAVVDASQDADAVEQEIWKLVRVVVGTRKD